MLLRMALPVGRRRETGSTTMRGTRRFSGWLWMAGFISFPVAGLLGRAVSGPVNDITAALAGGAITGAVLGAGQWLASRGRLGAPGAWIGASAAGYGVGLAAGAAAVDFGTGLGDLAVMGAVSGLALGGAQALVLARTHRRLARAWLAAMPALLALGWTLTSLAGVDVERQYTVFGASGAVVVTALTGLLIARLTSPGTISAPSAAASAA